MPLQRLNKFIANNTNISRRKADELISQNKVKVNDRIINQLGARVDPEKDLVKIDNKVFKKTPSKIYVALNKPAGYVSTRSDEFKRKTIMDLVPEGKNLKPVGRLDQDTEGLILLTNDGELIHKYTHPKFHCEKEYEVIIAGKLSQEEKTEIENGLIIEGRKTAPAKIKFSDNAADGAFAEPSINNISTEPSRTRLKIIIHEGRKRQIRKMFAQLKHPVKYLKRIRIGEIKLGPLKKGEFRLIENPLDSGGPSKEAMKNTQMLGGKKI